MDRPIPAFYCVYLLRSKGAPRSSLYIGSTPSPKRRLRQHNGVAKGGAKKTHSSTKRPWKMCVAVSGFPSNIAALQFEWAWQHPFRTRHINRLHLPQDQLNKEYTHKRLLPCIKYLHMLLRYKTFGRWPLHVNFFSFDAHQAWENYLTQTTELLPSHVSTSFISNDAAAVVRQKPSTKAVRPPEPEAPTPEDEPQPSIDDIDVSYAPYKEWLRKSTTALEASILSCCICEQSINASTDHLLFCPNDCSMTAHMRCLSFRFLKQEGKLDALVPTSGECPKCHAGLKWSDLVKELSLRLRGYRHVKKLLKRPRARKDSAPSKAAVVSDSDDDNSAVSDQEEFMDIDYVDPEIPEGRNNNVAHLSNEPIKLGSKDQNKPSLPRQGSVGQPRSPDAVVANSDSDDVEALSG